MTLKEHDGVVVTGESFVLHDAANSAALMHRAKVAKR